MALLRRDGMSGIVSNREHAIEDKARARRSEFLAVGQQFGDRVLSLEAPLESVRGRLESEHTYVSAIIERIRNPSTPCAHVLINIAR